MDNRYAGIWMTSHHPVLWGQRWWYPSEISADVFEARSVYAQVGPLYNLELEGHIDTIILAGDGDKPSFATETCMKRERCQSWEKNLQGKTVLSCTLGKYLGPRFGWSKWTRRSVPCDQYLCSLKDSQSQQHAQQQGFTSATIAESSSDCALDITNDRSREKYKCPQCSRCYISGLQFGTRIMNGCKQEDWNSATRKYSRVELSRWQATESCRQIEYECRNDFTVDNSPIRYQSGGCSWTLADEKKLRSCLISTQRRINGAKRQNLTGENLPYVLPRSERHWLHNMREDLATRLDSGQQVQINFMKMSCKLVLTKFNRAVDTKRVFVLLLFFWRRVLCAGVFPNSYAATP